MFMAKPSCEAFCAVNSCAASAPKLSAQNIVARTLAPDTRAVQQSRPLCKYPISEKIREKIDACWLF